MCKCKATQTCNQQEFCSKDKIVSSKKNKITIPKFSINSALFVTYTSFDGDKSRTNIRAISFPNSEVLFQDLALFTDDIIRLYFNEFYMQILKAPLPLHQLKIDDSDAMFINFIPRDESRKDSTCGVISICVIPNAQNLDVLSTQQGNLSIMPLKEYNKELFHEVQEFLMSDFNTKSAQAMTKLMSVSKDKKNQTGEFSDKDAEKAWYTLLRYYDKVPVVTDALVQTMVIIRKELNKTKE